MTVIAVTIIICITAVTIFAMRCSNDRAKNMQSKIMREMTNEILKKHFENRSEK